MVAALTPVETLAAEDSTPCSEGLEIEPELDEESLTIRSELDTLAAAAQTLVGEQPREEAYAELSCQVVVTHPGSAQVGISRAGKGRGSDVLGREPAELLDQVSYFFVGDLEIPVAPLFSQGDQTGIGELPQMAAGGGWRNICFQGELGRCESASAHEGEEDPRTGGISDQAGERGDIGLLVHEAFSIRSGSPILRLGSKDGLELFEKPSTYGYVARPLVGSFRRCWHRGKSYREGCEERGLSKARSGRSANAPARAERPNWLGELLPTESRTLLWVGQLSS